MGLDVTAYLGLTKSENQAPIEDEDCLEGRISFWENPYFPGRSSGVECGDVVYSYTDTRAVFSGMCSRYCSYRETLAMIAGYAANQNQKHGENHGSRAAISIYMTEGPFWEQILFSDCEGVLGPVVCAKLAKDYADFQSTVDAYAGDRAEYFKATYAEWREAFTLAANSGAIVYS